jgi:3-oxoacyl-[acyl-carrier-protein] synthase III
MSFYKPDSPIYIIGPSCITGDRKISNEDFTAWIGSDVKPSLLEKRTGINTRYWVSKDKAVSDLGYESVMALKSSHPKCLENLAD